MANIKLFLDQIGNARYGKEVRSSIVNALDAVNKDANYTVEVAGNMESLLPGVESATASANEAAANANEAAQAIFDEKYILTARTEFTKSASVSPTAKGNAIIESVLGDSFQKQLSGKQMFDKSTATDGVAIGTGGSTYTDSTMTASDYIAVVAGETYATTNIIWLNVYDAEKVNVTQIAQKTVNTFTVPDNGAYVRLSLATTKKDTAQLEKGSTATDYEEFCGNTPSPNPSFEQKIRSVGDMGWFDGEWVKGYLKSGVITSSSGGVSSNNYIPCKENDLINVNYTPNAIGVDTSDAAGGIAFYDENKAFLSVVYTKTTHNEATAPSDAKFFRFDIRHESTIEVSTVGHVCVTINGKYALIVDRGNKNILNTTANTYTTAGITFTVNDDKSITVNGTATADAYITVGKKTLQPGTYKLTGAVANGGQAKYMLYGVYDGVYAYDTGRGCVFTITTEQTETFSIVVRKGITITNGIFYPMLRKCDSDGNPIGDNTYVPHASKRTYIPIDEPLRGIGDVKDEICCMDGVYGVLRMPYKLVFDGSIDEEWLDRTADYTHKSNGQTRFSITFGNYRYDCHVNNPIMANIGTVANLTSVANNTSEGVCVYYNQNAYDQYIRTIYVTLNGSDVVDLETFRAWLAENPIEVVIPRYNPTFEPFEDQTPFYNFESYDEVTHISIAGCHEELNPITTMRFPRNEDGALVTTNWCENRLMKLENEAFQEELTNEVMRLANLQTQALNDATFRIDQAMMGLEGRIMALEAATLVLNQE